MSATHVAAERKISTIFALVKVDSAAIRNADVRTMTAIRRAVPSSALMIAIGTKRNVMSSQARRERVNLFKRGTDTAWMLGSWEMFDWGCLDMLLGKFCW